MADRTAQGAAAEQLACQYLEAQGLTLEARNVRCRFGEIDLIMRDSEYWVFVEVRSRRNSQYGTPAETVTRAKQQRIIHTAALYLQERGIMPLCRFDVVGILPSTGPAHITWIRDAFQLDD